MNFNLVSHLAITPKVKVKTEATCTFFKGIYGVINSSPFITAAQAAAGRAGTIQAAASGRQTEEDPTATRATAEVRRSKRRLFSDFLSISSASAGQSTDKSGAWNKTNK